MEANSNDTGFKEATDNDFSKLTDHIKNSEAAGFSLKGDAEPKKEEGTEETTDGKDKTTSTDSPGAGKVRIGKYVKSPWVLKVTNKIMPTMLVASFKLTGYEVDKKEFQLDNDDKEILEEPLQELLDYIVLDLRNPWNKFALAMAIVYGTKVASGVNAAKKVRKKKTKDGDDGMTYVQSTEELLDKLANPDDSWKEGYSADEIELIIATRKRRNKSYLEAIEWLKGKGQLKVLEL